MFIFNLEKVKNGENEYIGADDNRSIESKAKCKARLISLLNGPNSGVSRSDSGVSRSDSGVRSLWIKRRSL
jgi:hypothetical protein